MARKFASLSAFTAHLKRGMALMPEGIEAGYHEAGKLIEREAKAEIGTYQLVDTGPFAPWEELHDRTKDDRVKSGYSENEPGLREGDMRDSIGHTVTAEAVHIGSNDDKLVWFEIGTATQQPRSVLGVAAHRHGKEASVLVANAALAAVFGGKV
jgi:hypothetical protein